MSEQRVVGGLSCAEVLDRLSDYLDGELAAELCAALEEHLRGCDGCARFGGDFKATVVALREHLLAAPAPPSRLRERLARALDGVPGEDE